MRTLKSKMGAMGFKTGQRVLEKGPIKKSKSFVISRSLLKCFKNQNKLRIYANFV